MSKHLLRVTIAISLFAGTAVAQEYYRHEASASFIGRFTSNINETTVQDSSSNSGGLLASYRFAFKEHSSLEFTYGRTKNTHDYLLVDTLNGATNSYALQSTNQEYGFAYVFTLRRERKISPFVLAGGADLHFNPTGSNSTTGRSLVVSAENRGAFLYGLGVDYRFRKRWSARLQYRGLTYEAPDYNLTNVSPHVPFASNRWVQTAEPALGIVFKF